MAHAIEVAKDGTAQMIFRGETPWHGLGTQISGKVSVREALEQAGLNKRRDLVQLQLPDGKPVRQWAVQREDGVVHGFVGAKFAITQDTEAYPAMLDRFVDTGLAEIETAGSLKGGARTWMLAKIARPDAVIVPKADDVIRKFILLARGHDGWFSNHAGLTPIRVVCQNTLYLALDDEASGLMQIKNTAGALARIEALAETIESIDHAFEASAETFRALAARKIRSVKVARDYFSAVFPARPRKRDESDAERSADARKVIDEVEALFAGGRGNDRPGVRGTAWAAYNAVTEYLTWNRGRSQDARLDALWFRQDIPARALELAKEAFIAA